MAKKQTTSKAGSNRKRGGHRVFILVDRKDLDKANEIADGLEAEGFEVHPLQAHIQTQDNQDRLAEVHRQIESSDAFLFLFSKNSVDESKGRQRNSSGGFKPLTFKPFLEDAYYHALYHNRAASAPATLVLAILPNAPTSSPVPTELASFTTVDYRDPWSGKTQFDGLARALREGNREQKGARLLSALPQNPRYEIFKQVVRSEFELAFEKHMDPVRQSVDKFANIAKAQDNLMTPELISLKEANAYDDIWVVSHSLHNDLHNEEIADSVKTNLTTKGIRYTYFVPNLPHTDLISRKIQKLRSTYEKHMETASGPLGSFEFFEMEANVFMPFDEMVIYDGESVSERWGYFQMSYDNIETDRIFMKIPGRTLSTVVEYLKAVKNEGKKWD